MCQTRSARLYAAFNFLALVSQVLHRFLTKDQARMQSHDDEGGSGRPDFVIIEFRVVPGSQPAGIRDFRVSAAGDEGVAVTQSELMKLYQVESHKAGVPKGSRWCLHMPQISSTQRPSAPMVRMHDTSMQAAWRNRLNKNRLAKLRPASRCAAAGPHDAFRVARRGCRKGSGGAAEPQAGCL